jgi:alpha-tubulin suppressor-like RCC1 family protein
VWGDWGNSSARRSTDAPKYRNGFIKIYSTGLDFAALKADGSITSWGRSLYGGTDSPSGSYTKICSNIHAFAALKADGSIRVWGGSRIKSKSAFEDVPNGNGYTNIYSTVGAFAALKADGSITAWGDSRYGGTGAPSGNGYSALRAAKAYLFE